MIKGQVFSMDFLFAAIIAIIFLGTLLNAFETRTYLTKENLNNNILIDNSNSAFTILTNSKFACKTETGLVLPFSINKTELIGNTQIKSFLGLQDKNIFLKVDNDIIISEELGEKIISIEKDIFYCNEEIDLNKLNKCLSNNNCEFNRKKVTLKVSE